MAVLTSVTTEVSKINTKIDELIKEADGVKEKVQANKDAKTAADKVINGIVTQLLGNRSTVKGVEELNEDASRADEFTAMVNELNGKLMSSVRPLMMQMLQRHLLLHGLTVKMKRAIRLKALRAS